MGYADHFYSPSGNVYAKDLFEEISDLNVVDIKATDEFMITGQKVSKKWWDLFSLFSKAENLYDGAEIKGILPVSSVDLTGTDADISERLFVAESDVADFKNYCNEAENNGETVFLLRYRVSDYYAEEVAIFDGGWLGVAGGLSDFVLSTNAVIAQMHVDLGVEVIELEFLKDDCITVIPAVMQPVDNIPGITGDPDATPDEKSRWDELWEALRLFFCLFVIGLVLMALSFVMPFLKPVFRGFWLGVKVLLKVAWRILTFVPRLIFGFFKRE